MVVIPVCQHGSVQGSAVLIIIAKLTLICTSRCIHVLTSINITAFAEHVHLYIFQKP